MANETNTTLDKNKLFIKNIISKTKIFDEKKIIAIVAKTYSERLKKNIAVQQIEKQFADIIKETIAEFNQVEQNQNQETEITASEELEAIIEKRNQLFMKSGRRFLDNLLTNVMNKVLQDNAEYNKDNKDEIKTDLFASRTDIINKAKVDTWQDLVDFLDDYLDYYYDKGLYIKEPEPVKDKIDEEIEKLLAVTRLSDEDELSEEEREKLREERKKKKRHVPKIEIKNYITNSKFSKNYYSLLKKHTDTILADARTFRASEIAESFFDEHRASFKEEIDTRVELEIIEFLTYKVDSIYKVKDVESLFNEKIDLINSRVNATIQKLLKSKESRRYYLKMTPADIAHRIYELTLKDPKIGGIVGVDRDKTISIIGRVIKSDFATEDIFKKFS